VLTITLNSELESAIEKEAKQQGTTPELLAVDSLQKLYLPAEIPATGGEVTLADYWAEYIGSVDSSEAVPGGANLSEDTGRKFADLMREKYRAGKL
jgi:hypothetical protein